MTPLPELKLPGTNYTWLASGKECKILVTAGVVLAMNDRWENWRLKKVRI
jgi:hypothetical protein